MSLNHTILYAKSDHSRSEDLIGDLSRCLKEDSYNCTTKYEIADKLLELTLPLIDGSIILRAIDPEQSWKNGYKTDSYSLWFVEDEDNLPSYDYHIAVIHACLFYIKTYRSLFQTINS